MKPFVVGITGKARSGKDTVAKFISPLCEENVGIYHLASPLKKMLRAAGFPIDEVQKEAIIPAFGVSPRHLMQTLGTEWGRELIGKHVWLVFAEMFLEEVETYTVGQAVIIVPDVRFENEAQWVRSRGLLVHVRRDDRPQVREHVSEQGVTFDEKDVYIDNSGSLEDLEKLVIRDIMPRIK